MIQHDRRVHFEEVDSAGVVFFARFFGYCHDAMECFFDSLEGGYVGLIRRRKIGFPAVHASSDFKSPLRYGDVARIRGTVTKIGNSSAHFRFVMTRASDESPIATMSHVHACADLTTMSKLAMPDDVRAALETHRT